MSRVRELVVRATKDLELAKRYRNFKDYAIATVLYNKAIEKVLKALFISRTRKEPPEEASIGYLAKRAGMPEEISMYITSLQEQDQMSAMGNEDLLEEETMEQVHKNAEARVSYMDGLAKRLLDYVVAYKKI